MGFFHSLVHPKDFLDITTLKNGTIIVAVVELALSLLTVLGFTRGYSSSYTLISVICTVLCLYGVYTKKPKYVFIYFIYLLVCVILSGLLAFFSLFTIFGLTFKYIIIAFLDFIITLYACCVVKAYHKELENETLNSGNATNQTAAAVNETVAAKVDNATSKV